MNHYVCSECGGVSQHAGVCQTEGCMQEGSALKMCTCEDSKHPEVMNKGTESAEDKSELSDGKTVDLDDESSL